MSDAGPQVEAPGSEAPKRASLLFRSEMFRDPMVRYMTYAALGLVVVFLATVAGALMSGVFAPTGPRSAAERQLLTAADVVKRGAVGAAWAPYIDALVATGDLGSARAALGQARATVASTTAPVPALDLSESRLLTAEGRFGDAVEAANKAQEGFQWDLDRRIAEGGDVGKAARQTGLAAGYYEAAMIKGAAYVQLRRFADAVKAYDVYIKAKPTAADILVDRGNAKAEMGDKAGAEKDFREALKYVPYDEEAKAGLSRIGAK